MAASLARPLTVAKITPIRLQYLAGIAGRQPVEHDQWMENATDPLAQFGLDAIDLRWTLMDIAAQRSRLINKQHLAQLIELGLVEMREDVPHLTTAGQDAAWKD